MIALIVIIVVGAYIIIGIFFFEMGRNEGYESCDMRHKMDDKFRESLKNQIEEMENP